MGLSATILSDSERAGSPRSERKNGLQSRNIDRFPIRTSTVAGGLDSAAIPVRLVCLRKYVPSLDLVGWTGKGLDAARFV